jgi:hypothetical protein
MVFWSRLVIALALWCAEPALADAQAPPPPTLGRFEPTPVEVVERMLQLANVTADDVVYDLGSGDGRIVIQVATRLGARSVGVEIDPQLVEFSRREAKRSGVAHLATFINADALTVDVSPASVVTLFLTKQANLLLRPKLHRELRLGARVVSYGHDMGDWAPERVERIGSQTAGWQTIYLWRIGR